MSKSDSQHVSYGKPLAECGVRNVDIFCDALIRTAMITIILFVIAMGPVYVFIELMFVSKTFAILAVAIAFLAALAVSVKVTQKLWRQMGVSILVYSDRFVYMKKQLLVEYRWEDIQKFFCRAVNNYVTAFGIDQTYRGSRNTYRFTHLNGHQFFFVERYIQGETTPLSDFVVAGLLERQLPRLRQRVIQQKQSIDFELLHLDSRGIQYRRSLLSWERVDFVGTEDGKVIIREKHKARNWCTLSAEAVPNCCLFLALAKELYT